MKAIAQTLFLIAFVCMLSFPLLSLNLQPGAVAQTENRRLAPMPEILTKEGRINGHFPREFETWLSDHIGYRSLFVRSGARIRCHLFNSLPERSEILLGPSGELNYAPKEIIRDFQHVNRYSQRELKRISKSMQRLSDAAGRYGARFYYYQCWDKHSICPEQFPEGVLQIGSLSKMDELLLALERETNVSVISPKEELLKAKERFAVYSSFGDPAHWSQRGAYIGYQKLLDVLNEKADPPYRVLGEEDYRIRETDQGKTLYGCIHREELLEDFEIAHPLARSAGPKALPSLEGMKKRVLVNEECKNRQTLLVIGDSYFNTFLIDDLAESFYRTVFVWSDALPEYEKILSALRPDIVILEAAERADRSALIIQTAALL